MALERGLKTLRLFAPEVGGRCARSRERLRHLPYGVTGGTFGDGARERGLRTRCLSAPRVDGTSDRYRDRLRQSPTGLLVDECGTVG